MPHLAALRAQNFRCFERLDCALASGITVFVGDNAQGKTSILEAVCVLLRLQSPRTTTLADLARLGQPHGFGLAGDLAPTDSEADSMIHLKCRWHDGQRHLSAHGIDALGPSRYLAQSTLLVWMGNDDLALVRGSGEGRRRYLDFLGTQAFPAYRPAWLAYDKALRARNRLLKDERPDPRQIAAYTAPLLDHGTTLTHLRAELVDALAPWAADAHRDICHSVTETLSLRYHPGATQNFAQALATSSHDESRRRLTLVGPHRDDLALHLNGHPAATFASEGQQRTIALALKLAQARLLHSLHRHPPILLLDDIFGELDPHRRNALLQALPPSAQHLITTTHLDWATPSFQPHQSYRVHHGTLESFA